MIADSAYWEGFWSATRFFVAIGVVFGVFVLFCLVFAALSAIFEERPRRTRGDPLPPKSATTGHPPTPLR